MSDITFNGEPEAQGSSFMDRVRANLDSARETSLRARTDFDCLGVAPQARERVARTIRQFNDVRREVFGQDISTPFTGHDIVAYLDILRQHMVLPIGKTVPNGGTLRLEVRNLKRYYAFTYGQPLPKQDQTVVKFYYESLVVKKQVSLDDFFEKTWLTFPVVSRMVVTWLAHHVDHGTPSWDVTIARALSVVLQSALGCRAGDIALPKCYTDRYLVYRNVKTSRDVQLPPNASGPLIGLPVIDAWKCTATARLDRKPSNVDTCFGKRSTRSRAARLPQLWSDTRPRCTERLGHIDLVPGSEPPFGPLYLKVPREMTDLRRRQPIRCEVRSLVLQSFSDRLGRSSNSTLGQPTTVCTLCILIDIESLFTSFGLVLVCAGACPL